MKPAFFLFLAALPISPLHGQIVMEVRTEPDVFQARLGARTIAECWHASRPAPGLLLFDDREFFAPRLDLSGDFRVGSRLSGAVLARWDRGFDPGSREEGEFRLDEAFLRLQFFEDQRLQLQLGKFPTVFGNWVARHDFWDNPFLDAPLPYNSIVGVTDGVAPAATPAVVARRDLPDNKRTWVAPIWGPSYASGFSLFGSTVHWDYAAEVKNAALSSRPDEWNPGRRNFSDPTITGRIGWRPDAATAIGLSASHGAYLQENGVVPAGASAGDFDQTSLGADFRWAHHDLILTGEVIASRFETPAGDLDLLAYYLEGRWKFQPGMWVAARWGQMFFDDVPGAGGRDVSWDRDTWRAEIALGWRVTERLLLKAQYSHTHEAGGGAQGGNAAGVAVGWKF
jgi:hypothetical protein